MLRALLKYLMRRELLKNWGRRCLEFDRDCPLCRVWQTYEDLFYPGDDGKKDQLFQAHLKTLRYPQLIQNRLDPLPHLRDELEFYKENRADFVKQYEGKYLLIHGRQLFGHFDTFGRAYDLGVSSFNLAPFLVQYVTEN